jgi:hypothetical protein
MVNMNVHYKDYLRQWRLRVIYLNSPYVTTLASQVTDLLPLCRLGLDVELVRKGLILSGIGCGIKLCGVFVLVPRNSLS